MRIPHQAVFLSILGITLLSGCGLQNINNATASELTQTPVSNTSNSNIQRKNPLAGVYHPWKLHVISPLKTVSGTVERVRIEPDHDWHVNIKVDSQYKSLLRSGNYKHEHGDLVAEIIPMDQPNISKPVVGKYISVTGAYVIDGVHGGWAEIHPAWIVNGKGTANYTAAAAAKSVQTGIEGNKAYFGSGEGADNGLD